MRRLLGLSTLVLAAAALLQGAPAAAGSASAAQATAPVAIGGPAHGSVHAGLDDFTFDSFDADYTLTRSADGSSHLEVVETIVARFPDIDQNHGIARDIPDTYAGVPLNTVVSSATDENGAALPFTVDVVGDFMEVVLVDDDFVHGLRTYVIHYSQDNVVGAFSDTHSDEFYWDVNGNGWLQPFGRVSATVHVDAAVAPSLTGHAACYAGPLGSTNLCDVFTSTLSPGVAQPLGAASPDPSTTPTGAPIPAEPVEFYAEARTLGPAETLTVAIGFEAGTFVVPVSPELPDYTPQPVPWWMHLVSGGLGVLSLGALGGSIAARVRAGRGAKGRGVIIAEYSEPEHVTIIQAAHLVGRGYTAIPAAIVRLAVRHNMRILAYPTVVGGDPYTLQYLTHDRANAEDAELLAILFGSAPVAGALRGYGTGQQDLMVALRGLSSRQRDSLIANGMRRRAPGLGIGIAGVVVQVVLGVLALVALVLSFFLWVNASGFIFAAMVVIFLSFFVSVPLAYRPLQVTEAGAESRDFLLGMKEYLTLAEQDRLRMLQSPRGADRIDVGDNLQMIKLYERLLPWAVLWGVENQWMSELAVRVAQLPQQPDWFVGSTGFDVATFVSTVHGFSSSLNPPASTSGGWSSSGGGSSFSGGSFGGGFSGGGGGGGGGGGR